MTIKKPFFIALLAVACFAAGFTAKPIHDRFFVKHIYKSDVLAALEKPLPQFPNAPIIKESFIGCCEGKNSIKYMKAISIDISKLSYNQMSDIRSKYINYFASHGLGALGCAQGMHAFNKFHNGDIRLGGDRKGRYYVELDNKNFAVIIDTEEISYEPKNGMFYAKPVYGFCKQIDDVPEVPLKGQRVLNMYFTIYGFNLK